MPSAMDVTIDTNIWKIFGMGDFGTGKSVFASTFPTPGYIFDFDHGIETYMGKDFEYDQFEVSPLGWVAFEKKYFEIRKRAKAGEFKTVILDSTTTMEAVCMERSLQLDPKRGPTEGPLWNVHYGLVRNMMEPKLRGIFNFPCNVVMNAHLVIKEDQESGAVLGVEPQLTGRMSTNIPGLFSECYWFRTVMIEGKVHYRMRTVPLGHYKARSRISGPRRYLPDDIPNHYEALLRLYKKRKEDIDKKINDGIPKTETKT